MRASDQFKAGLDNSALHDRITLWLYEQVKGNLSLVRYLTGVSKKDKITGIERTIEAPLGRAGFADFRVGATLRFKEVEEDLREEAPFYFDDVFGFVEVKSRVSIGETIRQIRFYQRHTGDAVWTVCAPPFNESGILEEQGIKFLPYPGGLK